MEQLFAVRFIRAYQARKTKEMWGKHLLNLILLFPILAFSQADTAELKFHGYPRDTAFCFRHDSYHPWAWNKALTLKAGYMYSSYHSVEIGMEWLTAIGTFCDRYGAMGLTIGNDFLYNKKMIYGPKVSAEAQWMIFGGRLNATYYTENFKNGSFKIRPEVGLTILGYINVFYGYTFNITTPSLYNQKHSISVFGNIPVLKYYGHRRIKQKDYPWKNKDKK